MNDRVNLSSPLQARLHETRNSGAAACTALSFILFVGLGLRGKDLHVGAKKRRLTKTKKHYNKTLQTNTKQSLRNPYETPTNLPRNPHETPTKPADSCEVATQAARASSPRPGGSSFEGLGFRLEGLGFRVEGLGFRVWGLGFRV